MERIKEFLESSSIHGLNHIVATRKFSKLLWIVVVCLGFVLSVILISQSFRGWSDSPVSTTVSTHSISELDFPVITVCPPEASLTSLNQDLETVKHQSLSEHQKTQLIEYVSEAVFDSDIERKYQYLVNYKENDTLNNWYQGYSEINFPWKPDLDSKKYFWLKTSAASGTFSTPYFREAFNSKTFDGQLSFAVTLRMPDHIKNRTDICLVLQIDYDLEMRSDGEYVQFNKTERLAKKESKIVRHLPVSQDFLGRSSVSVEIFLGNQLRISDDKLCSTAQI